jgi:hypothetical protein
MIDAGLDCGGLPAVAAQIDDFAAIRPAAEPQLL